MRKNSWFKAFTLFLLVLVSVTSACYAVLWANKLQLPSIYSVKARLVVSEVSQTVQVPDGANVTELLIESGAQVTTGTPVMRYVFDVPVPSAKSSLSDNRPRGLAPSIERLVWLLEQGKTENALAELRVLRANGAIPAALSEKLDGLAEQLQRVVDSPEVDAFDNKPVQEELGRLTKKLAEVRANWKRTVPLVQRQLLPQPVLTGLQTEMARLKRRIDLARSTITRGEAVRRDRLRVEQTLRRSLIEKLRALPTSGQDTLTLALSKKPDERSPPRSLTLLAPIDGIVQFAPSGSEGDLPHQVTINPIPTAPMIEISFGGSYWPAEKALSEEVVVLHLDDGVRPDQRRLAGRLVITRVGETDGEVIDGKMDSQFRLELKPLLEHERAWIAGVFPSGWRSARLETETETLLESMIPVSTLAWLD
ncbi:putative HlyD family type I secretion protein [Pseudovibrio exalbescens]|uniref:HlyD family secretion protein n=1 Tax=Pseudovibrio exalbescens TaxID=197461 RepID=A0A1U7JFM4_9HYPH|nr:hypothetical protein [Pseudovibrio exalbescens]OKL43517.1 hypothetical protein A3843_12820 [Pseudovibrio exalbescens]